MGVKNWNFIPWRKVSLDEVEPRVIAIDAPNYLMRRMKSFEFKNKRRYTRIPTAHITVTMGLVKQALKASILPMFIFDGPPESLKRAPNPELVRSGGALYRAYRKNNDIYNEFLAEQLIASPALRWYFSVNHLKELLSALGIPAIVAPSEAEMLCAVLCSDGIAGTVLSNDADAILFGSPHVSKTLVLTEGTIERCTMNDIQNAIDLDIEQLRDLAIVSGCDFHEGIKGIGPRKGSVQLKRYGGLEGLLKAKGFSVSERESFVRAREVFDEPNYLSTNGIEARLDPPVVSRVLEVLKPTMGAERAERYASEIVKLWKNFGKEQSTLERWI